MIVLVQITLAGTESAVIGPRTSRRRNRRRSPPKPPPENEPPDTPDDPGAAAWNVLAISANPASRWAPIFPTLALNEAMSATGATAPALHVCAYQ